MGQMIWDRVLPASSRSVSVRFLSVEAWTECTAHTYSRAARRASTCYWGFRDVVCLGSGK